MFEATPYAWGAGVDGDIRVGTFSTGGIEAAFSEDINSLHFTLMGSFEGRRGRWGFLVDAMDIDMSETVGAPILTLSKVEASVLQHYYAAYPTLRVLQGDVAVDVFAGARYVSLTTILEVVPLTPPGGGGYFASGSENWWDGVGGVRVAGTIDKHWSVTGIADVATGGSKLTWELLAAAGYQFTDVISVKFGLRYLKTDYESGPLLYDVAMSGPYLGAGFRF